MTAQDSGRVNNSTVLDKLRLLTAQTDSHNCHVIKDSALPATGHPRLETSKAVTVVFQCPAVHPASRVGQSHEFPA